MNCISYLSSKTVTFVELGIRFFEELPSTRAFLKKNLKKYSNTSLATPRYKCASTDFKNRFCEVTEDIAK